MDQEPIDAIVLARAYGLLFVLTLAWTETTSWKVHPPLSLLRQCKTAVQLRRGT